ncbi:MAG: hypothetical protein KUG78_02165 [Kangiellaceae bacterium]|nr:hypothetical protein [Kangiellaceae bacterium]
MNSIFLRLYLVIVLTIVVVGIGLDNIWQQLSPSSQTLSHPESIIKIVALQLNSISSDSLPRALNEINRLADGEFSIIKGDIQLSNVLENQSIKTTPLFTEHADELVGLIKLQQGEILQYTFVNTNQSEEFKIPFILLFYSIIAAAVFLWIWPLSKDLNHLENAVKGFDSQQWNSKVDLPSTSSVNHLAQAYNALLERIQLLVETQKAMSHSISHELRTPLARIRFSLQMAEESNNIELIKDQLSSVTEDIAEMNELINELLSFAALEKVSVVAKLERGNINHLIDSLIHRLQRNSVHKNIEFIASEQGNSVYCDSYQMERAIQNLVVNACKFSQNKIRVDFNLEQNAGDKYYLLTVEDDGPGIDGEQKDSVFDSFVQLGPQTEQQGFGLGLAIVKRIMVLHHGDAMVSDSNLGGAKFTLRWRRPKQLS